MSLVELNLPHYSGPLPRDVRRFLDEAGSRIERFQARGGSPAFVPSDYAGAYGVLRALADAGLARGPLFCEWGSGFGVVAGLAALLGFEASGIEADADLVAAARRLAEDFGLAVEFAHASFIPPGAADRLDFGPYSWLSDEGGDAAAELGLDADDFDVIFAYPWPDEEDLTADLFREHAGRGAILVTYHGGAFRVRRKVGRKPRGR
jgi:hypothetical protein